MTIYLFNPFSEQDDGKSIDITASMWKTDKPKVVVTYKHSTFKNLNSDDSIYILAHGTPSPYILANKAELTSRDDFYTVLTITQVVERLIESGVTSENFPGKIKLFFCGAHSNPMLRAMLFSLYFRSLVNIHNKLIINFYDAFAVYGPDRHGVKHAMPKPGDKKVPLGSVKKLFILSKVTETGKPAGYLEVDDDSVYSVSGSPTSTCSIESYSPGYLLN